MPEQTGKKTKGKKSDPRRKGRDGRKNSPEKKEKRKSVNETVLGQLGKSDFMGAELTRAAGGSLVWGAGLRAPPPIPPACTRGSDTRGRGSLFHLSLVGISLRYRGPMGETTWETGSLVGQEV